MNGSAAHSVDISYVGRRTASMAGVPRRIPHEFKRDVVTVAGRGELTLAEVAVDFDISVESVRR